jgi:hypothetical protein
MFKLVKESIGLDLYCRYISNKYNNDYEFVKNKLDERLNKYKNFNIDINKISDHYDIMQSGVHNQKPLQINTEIIDIDVNIIEIIEYINKPFNRFITLSSCQHNGYGMVNISIQEDEFKNWIMYLFNNNKKAFDFISENDEKYIKYRFAHLEGYELPSFYISFTFEQPEIDFFKKLLKN